VIFNYVFGLLAIYCCHGTIDLLIAIYDDICLANNAGWQWSCVCMY